MGHPVVIPIFLQITLFFTHPVVCIYVEIEITFNIFLLSLEMPLIDDMHSLVQEKEARGAAEAARGGALQQVGEDVLLGMELPPMYIYAGPGGSKFPISSRFRYLSAYHYLQIHAKKMHYIIK